MLLSRPVTIQTAGWIQLKTKTHLWAQSTIVTPLRCILGPWYILRKQEAIQEQSTALSTFLSQWTSATREEWPNTDREATVQQSSVPKFLWWSYFGLWKIWMSLILLSLWYFLWHLKLVTTGLSLTPIISKPVQVTFLSKSFPSLITRIICYVCESLYVSIAYTLQEQDHSSTGSSVSNESSTDSSNKEQKFNTWN